LKDAEQRFRVGEKILDRALEELRASTNLNGIVVQGAAPGGRTYHYKNQFLSWDERFVRDKMHDFETERVTVALTYMEPADLAAEDSVSVLVRCEIFVPGQMSRVDHKTGYDVPLDDIARAGLAEVVAAAFVKGEQILTSRKEH
jgi:hypothetical protein